MSAREEDDFVTVAAVYSRSELLALLGLFRNQGIWAQTVGEGHARVEWPLAVALGGVEVRILASDHQLASELLADIDRSAYRGPVYSDSRIVDIALMLLICFFFLIPPPARASAAFYLDPRHSSASSAK